MAVIITRQPRWGRYMIFVNGNHEQSNSRRVDAFRRAKVIRQTWKTAETVEVVDTWAYKDSRFSF